MKKRNILFAIITLFVMAFSVSAQASELGWMKVLEGGFISTYDTDNTSLSVTYTESTDFQARGIAKLTLISGTTYSFESLPSIKGAVGFSTIFWTETDTIAVQRLLFNNEVYSAIFTPVNDGTGNYELINWRSIEPI